MKRKPEDFKRHYGLFLRTRKFHPLEKYPEPDPKTFGLSDWEANRLKKQVTEKFNELHKGVV